MQRVGTKELKEHTKQVLERVQGGEQILLTFRDSPVAVLSPIDTERPAFTEDVDSRDAAEQLEWLHISEQSFNFWDNEEDNMWDRAKAT